MRRVWEILQRVFQACFALALAISIVTPALPTSWTGAFGIAIIDATRKISVGQRWGMYAPNPPNAVSYLGLTAHHAKGKATPLPELEWAESGFGTHWAWTKRRSDIWQFYISRGKPGRQNPHRNWYIKAACVREARIHGKPPVRITAEVVTRRITQPDAVRRGKPDLSPMTRKMMQMIDCRFRPVRDMIEADRVRREQP